MGTSMDVSDLISLQMKTISCQLRDLITVNLHVQMYMTTEQYFFKFALSFEIYMYMSVLNIASGIWEFP